jgi:hypothetical protein
VDHGGGTIAAGASTEKFRAPLRAGFALLSLLFLVFPPSAVLALPLEAPPASLGLDPGNWRNRGGWHLHLGVAQRDTLATTPEIALDAARTAIGNDKWVVAPGSTGGRIYTHWKPINNVIFRLFSGKAFARCFITVTPLMSGGVQTAFQAGLATRRDIEHNPARALAERSYAAAVHVWQREVRKIVASRTSGLLSGGERIP